MFGFSFSKLLLLVFLIVVVWTAFKYARRVEAIRLRAELPPGVSLLVEAQVWEPWWLRDARRFEARRA